MIVCVSEIWDDPHLNSTSFVDMDRSDPIYVKIIKTAMNDRRKMASMSGDDHENICDNIVIVSPPCSAQDAVTIYVD